jgi:hypothetical protein
VNIALLLVNFTFTREFRAFTREFRAFTREFRAFTREFRAFTREFCAFTREVAAREVGAIHKKETPLLAGFPEYMLLFCSLITSRHI